MPEVPTTDYLRLRGQWVTRWHPDSPGIRVLVWCPWFKRKKRSFATLHELTAVYRPTFDATASNDSSGYGR